MRAGTYYRKASNTNVQTSHVFEALQIGCEILTILMLAQTIDSHYFQQYCLSKSSDYR